MSWRAPPSRPAPPVTSSTTTSLDQLFVGPSSASLASSTSSRSRNPSASSSSSTATGTAHALLSRKMMELAGGGGGGGGGISRRGSDDDRMSVKSSRPTSGRNGNSRQRAGSSTSVMTARGTTTDEGASIISLRGIENNDDLVDEPMSVEAEVQNVIDKGKGKEKEPPSPSKRARLNSSRARTNSTMSTASSISPLSRSNPSPSASSASLSPSRSSSSLIAPLQPSAPVASTSTSSHLSVSPSQGFLSPKRWVGRPVATSTLLSSAAKLDPDPQIPSESTTDAAISTSTLPATSSTRSDHCASATAPTSLVSSGSATTPVVEDENTTTPKAEKETLDLPVSTPTPTSSTPGGGWLSMISRSVYGSSTDVAGQASVDREVEQETVSTSGSQQEAMQVDPPVQQTNAETIKTGISRDDETLKQAPEPEPYNSDTLTPRTLRTSRSSWWLWGGATEVENSPAEPNQGPAQAQSEAIEATASGSSSITPIVAPEPSTTAGDAQEDQEMSTSSKNVSRSWIQTIWGESPEELAERRKREARALKMVIDKSNLRIEGTAERKLIEDGPTLQESQPSTSVNSTSSYLDSSSSSVSEPPKQLRTKTSSWAIFSRANPIASSAASTRSRASSHQTETTSLPPSPNLRPQPDGPVKPLTGSIRSATPRPRQRTTTPIEPDPPFDNLVLPTFSDTFLRAPRSFPPKKSNLNRAVSLVSAYLFNHPPTTSPPPTVVALPSLPIDMKDDPAEKLPKALEVMSEPSRLTDVKRVVCIGVSGWFPNPRLKSLLGEPTGTSVKFATMMYDSVQTYLESSGVSSFNIQAIALEGQGQVEDRVNKLYSQLSDREEWVQAIKKADVVFLATHSQGTVVSTQLLARMLDQRLIVGTQTHLLCMCGIAQGPFVYLYQSVALAPYFNFLESAAARELFEYQDAESVVSIKFLESLRMVLNAGIKVTVVGSINDQVVPLYSALFSGVSHPAILRAVYIDSDAFQTSDFLANLVVFSARLRNAGLSDHDLVYHLSEALSGALTGVGHSKIYEEEEVFNLAVRHQFETTSLTEAPTFLDVHGHAPPLSMSFQPRDRRNPYLLTWALRGIIEDTHVRQLFGNELKALGEAYEVWKPQTKVLKDCKLKLEGIRMITRNNAGKL
ncbi:hypothetical protein JCM11491_003706 [Sporobolomyces phaffii]